MAMKAKAVVFSAKDIIRDRGALNKAIDSIKKRGANLDRDIQVAGLSALQLIEDHSDIMAAEQLVAAMPKSARKHALVEWVLAYGKVRKLSRENPADAEALAKGRVFAFDRARKTDIEGACEKPWYEFKPERPLAEAFDAQAAVMSLMNRINNAANKHIPVEHKAEAVEALKSLIAKLES